MNTKLLYFPYTNIPNNAWTTRSILYWDTVGTIIPDSFLDNPSRFQQHMRDLIEHELVELVIPYFFVRDIPNFDESFINLTQQKDFNLELKQKMFALGNYTEVFAQKFGNNLFNFLFELRLAVPINRHLYAVETITAKLLMIYLATIIGRVGQFTPATDKIENIDFTFSQEYTIPNNILREKLLQDLLPYPITNGLIKLKNFKEKYAIELTKFRLQIEQLIIILNDINDEENKEKLYKLKLEEIKIKKDEILAKLTESQFNKIIFGSVFGTIVGTLSGSPFELLNSIYNALEGYGERDIIDKEFSYLALIDKKLAK